MRDRLPLSGRKAPIDPMFVILYALLILLIVGALISGCRSPLIEVNRNAPLINVQDAANGNTVPLVGGQ